MINHNHNCELLSGTKYLIAIKRYRDVESTLVRVALPAGGVDDRWCVLAAERAEFLVGVGIEIVVYLDEICLSDF